MERLILPEPTGRKRKTFGQHFLRSDSVIRDILHAAQLRAEDHVWEIGCGDGALTVQLAVQKQSRFEIIEKDQTIVDAVHEQWPDQAIHLYDATQLADPQREGYPESLIPAPTVVVSNLPYSASTAIFRCFFEPRFVHTRLVLMFQKEVGQRIEGREKGDRGPLAILSDLLFDVRRVALVRPGAFVPPPKVDSVVLQFNPRPDDEPEVLYVRANAPQMWQFLSKSFARRRKTLWNNLKPFWPEVADHPEYALWLKQRPEDLTSEQWLMLFQDFMRK